MIKEKLHENSLDVLNATIASMQNEIAELSADLKSLTDSRNADSSSNSDSPQANHTSHEEISSAWTRFQHQLSKAGKRSKKISKGVAEEIERHPLIGGLATFGIGFFLAKRLFMRKQTGSDKISG